MTARPGQDTIASLARPVSSVPAATSLGRVLPTLQMGDEDVLVDGEAGLRVLDASSAAGHAPTRLLADLPQREVVELPGETSPEDALDALVRADADLVVIQPARPGEPLRGARREWLLTAVLGRARAAAREIAARAEQDAIVAGVHEVISHHRPEQALAEVGDRLLAVLRADAVSVVVQHGPDAPAEALLGRAREGAPAALLAWPTDEGARAACGACLVRAFEAGEAIQVADLSGCPAAAAAGVRACLVQPVLDDQGEWRAALLVQHLLHPSPMPDAGIEVLGRVGPALGAAVAAHESERALQQANVRLEERVRQRTFELEVLNEMAERLGTTLNYDDLFAEVARGLRSVVGHDLVLTLVCTDEVRELVYYPRRPVPGPLLAEAERRLLDGLAAEGGLQVDPEGLRPVLPHFGWDPESPAPLRALRSFLNVPLVVGPSQEVVGGMLLASEAEHAFSPGQARLLHAVVSQAAVSVERLRALVAGQRRRMVALVEHLPEGVALLDRHGLPLVWNRRAETDLGHLASWRPGEPVGGAGDLGWPELAARADADPLEVRAGGRVYQVLLFSVTGATEHGVSGVGRYVLVARDVTREREVQEQARTQQRLVAVGQLAGGVAHDFNNLLTVILSSAYFAREALPPGHPARADVEQVEQTGQRGARLVQQLLAFSRKQTLQPERVELSALLRELQRMLSRLISEAISLELDLAPALPEVLVDPAQIDQVIVNLVVNARDAMPGGGTLAVRTGLVEVSPGAAPPVLGMDPGRYVFVAVADTGEGMSLETQARIFEPFFTTKAPGLGTGLGLATVYGVVKQSGGHLRVQSAPGQGSTFWIYLPASPGVEHRGVSEAAQPDRPDGDAGHLPRSVQGHGTVLLAEDSRELRALAARALRRSGYEVLEAPDGQEAIRIGRAHVGQIDLLLTDVVMPGATGPEAAAALRASDPDLRVIFMSGYADESLPEHGLLRARDVRLVHKPFTVRGLLDLVREVLSDD